MVAKINCLLVLVFLSTAILARADDQEKAQKEIKRVASFAVDSNCRSVINRTEAETFNLKRSDLVKERQDVNLNYGGVFLVHELIGSGSNLADIVTQLKAGKSILDVANAQHANWKQIAADSKKMNKKIDDNMIRHFNGEKADLARDAADNYDAKTDRVAADSDASKEDVAEAQNRYQHLHELAAQNNLGVDAATKSLSGVPSTSSH